LVQWESMIKQTSIKSFLQWLDENILLILGGFLLAFVPLWPKIPIFSPIEQYIVRVRAEDFVLLITGAVWLVQVLRKKVRWQTPMFWFVVAYAAASALSLLVAVFFLHTIPQQPLHVGKSLLHFFRYLEYFSIFFILFSAIRKRSHALLLTGIFSATILCISLYGYGQKYFYWPVYSTMNREFSKGVRLYLTEHARIQSTFGGHYDMASYLVIVLPILLALALKSTKAWRSAALQVVFWIGTWLLIMSASRTPFAAFLVATLMVIGIDAWQQSTWKERIKKGFAQYAKAFLMIGLLFFYFGDDLSERLDNYIGSNEQLSAAVKSMTETRRRYISDASIESSFLSPKAVRSWLPKSHPPDDGISTDDVAAAAAAASQVATISDVPPVPFNATKATPTPKPTPAVHLPSDVYVNVPDEIEVATVSATGEVTTIKVKRQRVWSPCALKKELSLCIRLEALWPRALNSFFDSPLVGTGYATITKENVDQFTEADSTDNNFLRTLGETGALGFITFYGSVALVIWYAIKKVNDKDMLVSALSVGMLCGTIGLLLNAIYIDVFAASKVALTYWAIAGAFVGLVTLEKSSKAKSV
jgi:hypothetical protein